MKVRITSCSDARYWYANRVGETYTVEHEASAYWVREPGGYRNFIQKQDAEVVE